MPPTTAIAPADSSVAAGVPTVGHKPLPGSKPMAGNGGKGHGVTAYGRVASLADWEPSGKGDGIGGWVFFVSTADEVRGAG